MTNTELIARPLSNRTANVSRSTSHDDARVIAALEEYLALCEHGPPPNRETFLADFPEVAAELGPCLEGLALVHAAAPGVSNAGPLATGFAGGSRSDNSQGPLGLPESLGDFRILREVGRGGMGVVYEAEQISLRRRVALKVLPFAAVLDPRHLQRFKNEALAAASLDHPNIVEVHGVGCERGVHFYAMRYVEGQTLAAVIDGLKCGVRSAECEIIGDTPRADSAATPNSELRTPNSADTAVAALSTLRTQKPRDFFRTIAELGIQAAEALDHAHQMGIVHRDIKPSNLMLESRNAECGMRSERNSELRAPNSELAANSEFRTPNSELAANSSLRTPNSKLWITDFGLAHIESDTSLTMTGDLVGTLRYMSPEQAEGKSAVLDHRTDIYSLGITLYELLTLRPAFPATDRQALLRQIAQDEPTAPRKLNTHIPADLETIVFKSIAKDPRDRYVSAADLAADLHRYTANQPLRARRPSFFTRMRKWRRRNATLLWAAGISAMIGLAVAAAILGWTLRDRELRLASTRHEIGLALQEASVLMQQENWPDALASARRAEVLSADMSASDALTARRLQICRDAEMAMRLNRIRLDHASVFGVDGQYNFAGSVSEYRDAFRDYGLDIEELPHREAVERIRQSAIAEQLRLALEEWLGLAEKSAGSSPRPQILLAIANEVDPDQWRAKVREAIVSAPDVRRTRLLNVAADIKNDPVDAETVVLLAQHLRMQGTAEQAEPLLRAAYLRNPADFEVCFELGHIYRTAKPPQLDEAIRFFSAAVASRPQTACALNNLGYVLMQKGTMSEAIACFREALHRQHDFAPAHHNLGYALSQGKTSNAAIGHYREAIRLWPSRAVSPTNLGYLFYKQGDYDEAIACLKEAIRRQSDYAVAHRFLGDAYLKKGDLDAAIDSFRQALRLEPDSALSQNGLAVALGHKGALDEAIHSFAEAIRLQPDVAQVHVNLADVLREQGDVGAAILSYREAIRLDSDFRPAYSRLGGLYFTEEKWDEAVECFRHYVRLEPTNADAHYHLGCALAKKNDIEGAITSLSESIRLKPDLAPAYSGLGGLYFAQEQWEEAADCYRNSVRLEPTNAVAHYNLGNALLKKNDIDATITSLSESIRLKPDYSKPHNLLGNAHFQKKDYDAAIAEWKQAVQLAPKSAFPLSSIGAALHKKGDLDGAIQFHRKAIAVDPTYSNAHYNLACALRDRGNTRAAIESYEQSLWLNPDFMPARADYDQLRTAQTVEPIASSVEKP